ncbi:MAG TPA: hypothetical protein VJV03_10165, partial [Pyrinomonadaceae bacterium]|nr:hypothetical protein [Pyrinomonadaceae bacterium]
VDGSHRARRGSRRLKCFCQVARYNPADLNGRRDPLGAMANKSLDASGIRLFSIRETWMLG